VCMESASAVDEQAWASVRSTSHISECEAPPPPSSAGTAAEKNRSLPRGFAFAAHTGRAVQEWYWQEGALNLDPQ